MSVSTTLPQTRYAELQRALEAARAELLATTATTDDDQDTRSEGTLGETEHLTEDAQRQIDSVLDALQRDTLREIDAALARLADGTFGRCVTCDREIPIERIEALPSAANCISCQSAAEHTG